MTVGQATVNLPTLDEVRAAAELVYRLMLPTPQYRWPLLCERLGTEVWVKHENHTPIGAFKARTAIVYAEELLKREPGTRGLIAATRGNHGQSVALAAQRKNLECVIVVPYGNSVAKTRPCARKAPSSSNTVKISRPHWSTRRSWQPSWDITSCRPIIGISCWA